MKTETCIHKLSRDEHPHQWEMKTKFQPISLIHTSSSAKHQDKINSMERRQSSRIKKTGEEMNAGRYRSQSNLICPSTTSSPRWGWTGFHGRSVSAGVCCVTQVWHWPMNAAKQVLTATCGTQNSRSSGTGRGKTLTSIHNISTCTPYKVMIWNVPILLKDISYILQIIVCIPYINIVLYYVGGKRMSELHIQFFLQQNIFYSICIIVMWK